MTRFRWILLFAILFAILVLAAQLMGAKTELDIQREQIEVSWVKVEQDLERRAEALERLVALLQLPHPARRNTKLDGKVRKLVLALQESRAASTRSARIETNGEVERAFQAIRATIATDAQARSDDELQRMLEEVVAVENRIHRDRTEYNEAVQRFNVQLVLFPANVAAKVFGISRHDFYVPTELLATTEDAQPLPSP